MRIQTLHLSFPGERAYRLLCAEGHVFMLTDRRLLAFANLASRFLQDEPIANSIIRSTYLEAVDASLKPDRSLLVVLPDSVYCLDIDSMVAPRRQRPGLAEELQRTSVDTWDDLYVPIRQESQEMELAGIP